MQDDLGQVIADAVAGDQLSFQIIVDRHAGLVWSIIRSYRLSRSDGEDAAQGVWLAVVQHLGQLREPDRLPGWIATTTRRECLSVIKRTSRVPESSNEVLERLAAKDTDPDRALLISERSRALAEAFADLDERCRELLSLLGTDPPLQYQDVAEVLAIPIGAIGPTRTRCLEKIRRHRSIQRLNFT
jgi:RNA polymerase sigma factor (sigma-70 family)